MKRSATPELLDTDSGTSAEVATALARVRTFIVTTYSAWQSWRGNIEIMQRRCRY
jgi:hypothetical protein